MTRLEPARTAAPGGVTRTRCTRCKRFARLLPGETLGGRCSGVLALDFGRGDR